MNCIGQEKVENILQNIIKNNKINQSYIFLQKIGEDNIEIAREFANEIADKRDIYTISLQKGKQTITVEQVREKQGEMLVKPLGNKKQVYIIEFADKMTPEAQNCLLKTLEEPNEYVVIILCVANVNKLIKTVQSRCIKITFADTQATVDEKLKNEIIDLLINIEMTGIVSVIDYQDTFEKQKDNIQDVLKIMNQWYRDYMIYKMTGDETRIINQDKKDYIINNSNKIEIQCLLQITKLINDTFTGLRMNANYQMLIDNLVIGIWEVYNDKGCRSAI